MGTRVQTATRVSLLNTTSTSISVSFASLPTSGNAVIATGAFWSPTAGWTFAGATDNQSNSYDNSYAYATKSDNRQGAYNSSDTSIGSPSGTFTVTVSTSGLAGSGNYLQAGLFEVSGLDGASARDSAAIGTTTSQNLSSTDLSVTSGTLAQADSYFVATGTVATEAGDETSITTPTNYTNIYTQSNDADTSLQASDRNRNSGTTAETVNWSHTNGTGWLGAALVVPFKNAAAGGVTATLSVTQAANTLSAAAAVPIAAALSVTQAANTLSATASIPVTAALNAAQAANTLSGTASIPVTASLNQTQAADTLSATAAVGSGVAASLNVTQASDSLSAAASIPITASLSTSQAANTLSATASTGGPVTADLSVQQSDNTLTATGQTPQASTFGGAPFFTWLKKPSKREIVREVEKIAPMVVEPEADINEIARYVENMLLGELQLSATIRRAIVDVLEKEKEKQEREEEDIEGAIQFILEKI